MKTMKLLLLEMILFVFLLSTSSSSRHIMANSFVLGAAPHQQQQLSSYSCCSSILPKHHSNSRQRKRHPRSCCSGSSSSSENRISDVITAISLSSSSSSSSSLSAVTAASEGGDTNNNSNSLRGGGGGGDGSTISEAAAAAAAGVWPCLDSLDRKLIKLSLPVIGNFAINPLIGAVDLFWVGRMGNALAVAGMAAANQVFTSTFWLTSFLPSVTATMIAKENAAGNKKGVQDAVCQALFVGMLVAVVATGVLFTNPGSVLKSVIPQGAPSLAYAKPYLIIRALAFLPSLISLVGYSAFRGILETTTPVKISASANLLNALLDPILIFSFALGVPGAAYATLAAEVISAGAYLHLMRKRQLIPNLRRIVKPPQWKQLEPLLRGGAALQLRNVALNLTFLMVARVTQTIDQTGVAAAAHAMAVQVFQVGGIVLLALSTVAQTVVPNDLVIRYDQNKQKVGGKRVAKATVNRLMGWGLILGILLGSMQIVLIPLIGRASPLQEVRDAARAPAILASILQVINGLVFIGEGVMVGTGNFMQLSLSTMVATAGCLWALRAFPPIFGLTGVWLSFGVFNLLRLTGVYIHQFVNGPLAPKNLNNEEE